LWGVQARGLDGITPVPGSLKDMAKNYGEEILSCCSGRSPVLLGGSMGGAIAVEVARYLELKGLPVKLVVMIDTIGPESIGEAFAGLFIFEGISDFFQRLKKSIRARAEYYSKSLLIKFYLMSAKTLPARFRPIYVEAQHRVIYSKYAPERYVGKVVLIRQPLEASGLYADAELGWGSTFKELKKIYVTGDHAAMIEDLEVGMVIGQLIDEL